MNGKKPLTLDYKTFVHFTGLDYSPGTYVSHPSLEAVNLTGQIVTNPSCLDKTPVLKKSFLMAWRILFTFVIRVLREIIYSDLVTKVTSKSRQKYVSYLRFISCALEVLLGAQYTQDENFGSFPGILSNSNFLKDPSKVTEIELTALMIAVNNIESSVALRLPEHSLRREISLSPKRPPFETQVTPPSVPTKDSEKTQSVSLGQIAHPQYTEGNTQPVVKPANKGFPSTVSDEGTVKTKLLPEGPHGDKDSEGFKPPADMEPLTTLVANLLRTDAKILNQTLTPLVLKLSRNMTMPSYSLKDNWYNIFKKSLGYFIKDLQKISGKNIRKQLLHMLILKSKIEGFHNAAYKVYKGTEAAFSTYEKLLVKFQAQFNKDAEKILGSLKVIQDTIKEDPALNKKVIEATEAYTKNSTNLTKLLPLIKSFNFHKLKSLVESLQASPLRQDEDLAK
nr:hypothetical protein [Tanacetum cinerariifolium]